MFFLCRVKIKWYSLLTGKSHRINTYLKSIFLDHSYVHTGLTWPEPLEEAVMTQDSKLVEVWNTTAIGPCDMNRPI